MSETMVLSMSGGLDSTTLAYRALSEGFTILPINFNYKQKHIVEIVCFENILKALKERFSEKKILNPVTINLSEINAQYINLYTQLRDSGVIKEKSDLEFYTPSRNLLFSAISAQIAEIYAINNNLTEISIGLGIHKHEGYRNYWDITSEFADKLQKLLYLNDVVTLKLYVPYVSDTKQEIIKDAIRLKVPYKQTWTCYNPVVTASDDLYVYKPCGICEACKEREMQALNQGIEDINDYQVELTKSEIEQLKGLANDLKGISE